MGTAAWRSHSPPDEDHWVTFTDVSLAFSMALLLALASALMIIPKDLVDELIAQGQRSIGAEINGLHLGTGVSHHTDGHRQTITLGADLLFSSASYDLSRNGKGVLLSIAKILKAHQGRVFDPEREAAFFSGIDIDGHTDPQKPGGKLLAQGVESNWHLSALRAIEVLRFLESAGLDSRRMAARGFADTKRKHQAWRLNRRVEITLRYSPEEVREAFRRWEATLRAPIAAAGQGS